MSTEYKKKKILEMKMTGKKPRGRPQTRWLGQVKRETEKTAQSCGKVEETQIWTDRQVDIPLQKSTHNSGNDKRKKK
jgi:hypothetical protein